MKTFAQHLHELKIRFFVSLGFLLVGCLIGVLFYKSVEAFLQQPLGQNLYYTTPVGGLGYVMQICLLVGVVLALPVIMFEIAQFVRPALKPVKTRLVIVCIVSSLILTVLGFLYAYVVSLPAALHFLVTFNGPHVKPLINANDYLRFLFAYIIGTVVAFQLPLILFFMNKVRRFPPGTIWRVQRPFIVGAIIFAGIVTPTVDPINQMICSKLAEWPFGSLTVSLGPLPSLKLRCQITLLT